MGRPAVASSTSGSLNDTWLDTRMTGPASGSGGEGGNTKRKITRQTRWFTRFKNRNITCISGHRKARYPTGKMWAIQPYQSRSNSAALYHSNHGFNSHELFCSILSHGPQRRFRQTASFLRLCLDSPFLTDSSRIGASLLAILSPEVSCRTGCLGYWPARSR